MNFIFFTKKYVRNTIAAMLAVNVVLSTVLLSLPHNAHADETREDQVIVTQVVTAAPDIVAPSVPANVVATAISTTAITVTWNASTDNVNVAGYRVFRDGVFVATTTALSYADTGLVPSTLYGYEVSAFDPSLNISATSTPIAEVTTLTPTVTPPAPTPGASAGGAGTSGFGDVQLLYLLVNPSTHNATISFGSNRAVVVTTAWGTTPDFELGSSVQSTYKTDHTIVIPGLAPDTQYYFNLRLVDEYGRVYTVTGQQFRTLPIVSPSVVNVSEFEARARESHISLSWKNPTTDFDVVRIVRSDKFFPRDPSEGQVIYEGTGRAFDDRSVVAGITYYYSLFTVRDGRYSSGATAFARISKDGAPAISDLFADLIELPSRVIHPLIAAFSLDRIIFAQNNTVLPMVQDTVTIDAGRTLSISVPYGQLPEVLKTMVVTLFAPDDPTQSFSFLLRVNEEKTAYEAVVAPLERAGTYKFRFLILDHKHQGLKKLFGAIEAVVPQPVVEPMSFFEQFMFTIVTALALVVIGLIIVVVWFVVRRRARRALVSTLMIGMMVAATFSSVIVSPSVAHAAFNKEINYQGKLLNASNATVPDGTYHMRFFLYTSETGGSPIFTEDRSTAAGDRVAVTSGLFSVMLGSSSPLDNINFDQTLYLGVEIGGSGGSPSWDGEMTPRKVLGAVPAAFQADKIDNLSSEQFVRNDATNSTSTATTFLTFIQSGAGAIARFIGAGSAAVLDILSSGNVGVGTTSPSAKLSIHANNGETNANLFAIASSTAVATTTLFSVSNTGQITAASGAFTLSSAGAISRIGNTAVNLTSAFWQLSNSGGDVWFQNNNAAAASGIAIRAGTNNDANTAVKFFAGSDERARINALGNFGIGTTSPYARLSVVGETVSEYFTATSTTALNTFPNLIFTNATGTSATTTNFFSTNFRVNNFGLTTAGTHMLLSTDGNRNVVSTSTPTVAAIFATSTTATSTFNGSITAGNGISVSSIFTSGSATGITINMPFGATTTGLKLEGYLAKGVFDEAIYGQVDTPDLLPSFYGVDFAGIASRGAFLPSTSGRSFAAISATPLIRGSFDSTNVYGVLSRPFSVIGVGGLFSTVTQMSAYEAQLFLKTGTVTDYAYFNASVPDTVTGTITNLYGLKLPDITQGATLNYAIRTGLGLVSFGDKVGIGTTTPYAPLSVVGEVVAARFTATTSTASVFPYASTTALTVAGTNGLTLGSLNGPLQAINGAVSATSTLSVAYGGTGVSSFGGTNTLLYTTSANTLASITTANSSILVTNGSGVPSWGTTLPAYTLGGAVTGNSQSITGLSAVAIGTTTNNNLLDLFSGTKAAIGFSGASGPTYKWTIGMDVTNGGRFAIASSTALGTIDRLVIDGNGNVGIGTSSPYARLSVVGEVVAANFTATSTTATSTFWGEVEIASSSVNDLINSYPVAYGQKTAAAFRYAKDERVAWVNIGDSNMVFGGHGWDHGISKALEKRFGLWSTGVQPINGEGQWSTLGYLSRQLFGTIASTSAPSGLAAKFTNTVATPPYAFLSGGSTSQIGMIYEGDASRRLRYHFTYGTRAAWVGNFKPEIRKGSPPYTQYVTTSVINTSGTDDAYVDSSIDLPPNTATTTLNMRLDNNSQSINAEFFATVQQVEDLDKNSGFSAQVLGFYPSNSAKQMLSKLNDFGQTSLTEYFRQVRRLLGQNKVVVIGINEGLNDRNDSSGSLGPNAGLNTSTKQGFQDNMQGMINLIRTTWTDNGWDTDTLYFVLYPSHAISQVDDQQLKAYRAAAAYVARVNENVSAVDLSKIMSYNEMSALGYYNLSGADINHLTQSAYEDLAGRMIDYLSEAHQVSVQTLNTVNATTSGLMILGNTGINATSTNYSLAVGGTVAADRFFATSTTATSTFMGGGVFGNVTSQSAFVTIKGLGTGTGQMFAVQDSLNNNRFVVLENGNVGIGTSTPGAALAGYGTALFSNFTAASTTNATSTFGNTTFRTDSGALVQYIVNNGARFNILSTPSNPSRLDFYASTTAGVSRLFQSWLDDGTTFNYRNVWNQDNVIYGVDSDESGSRFESQVTNIPWGDFGGYNDLIKQDCYRGVSGQVNNRTACLTSEGRYQTTSNGDQYEWHLQIDNNNVTPNVEWRPFHINATWDGRSNEGFTAIRNSVMSWGGAFASTSQLHTNFDQEAVKFSIGGGIDSVLGIPNATLSATLGIRSTSSANVSKNLTYPSHVFLVASTSAGVATSSMENVGFAITNTQRVGVGTSSPTASLEVVNKANQTTNNIFEVFRQSSYATTSALSVTQARNVGIGTSTPTLAKLSIQSAVGDVFNQNLFAVASSSLQSGALFAVSATGTLVLRNGEAIENGSSGQMTFRAYNNASGTNCALNADLGEAWAFGVSLSVSGHANCGAIRFLSSLTVQDGTNLYMSGGASAGLINETAGGTGRYTFDIGTYVNNSSNNQSGIVRIGQRGNIAANSVANTNTQSTVAQPRLRMMPAAGGTGTFLDLYSDNVNNQIDWLAGNLVFGTTTASGGALKNIILGTSTTYTRVGVGTTTPWRGLSVTGTLGLSSSLTSATTGNYLCINNTTYEVTSGTTCSASSERFKENVTSLPYGLSDIARLNPVTFTYRPQYDPNDRVRLGFMAEQVEGIIPELVNYDSLGLPESVDYAKLTPVLAQAVKEIAQRIDLTSAPTTTPSIVIDSRGNVGVGTSSPVYKLTVSGDMQALGVSMPSSRALMQNVVTLGADTYQNYLGKIRGLNLSTYSYAGDTSTSTRLGIVGDEAPSEILTASGDVDIFKLAMFTLGGVKAQQIKIDQLESRISLIEQQIAAGTLLTSTSSPQTSFASVITGFGQLGAFIEQGIARFTALGTETFTVGSTEKPSGITLYDEVTKQPYCLKIANGQTMATPGVCTASVVVPPEPPVLPPQPPVDPGTSTPPKNIDELPVIEVIDTAPNTTPDTSSGGTTPSEPSSIPPVPPPSAPETPPAAPPPPPPPAPPADPAPAS